MNCSKCGKITHEGGKFCEYCGATTNQSENKIQVHKESKLQTAALVMGILGFIIPFITSLLAIIFGAMTLKEKPNTKAVIGLVLGIVSFAIIPILASMILVSLDTARSKAKDARIKSNITQERVNAEVYFDENNSYKNYTLSDNLENDIIANSLNQNKPELKVKNDGTAYAIIVTLNDGSRWCVDSSGFSNYSSSINNLSFQCTK